mmetsp:Transcript_40613/g.122233  ORF Transcript_40613/g.122233 Transcript_40613/m.122233 type:complete len:421 (-) Transcript_40613:1471-2733(-)
MRHNNTLLVAILASSHWVYSSYAFLTRHYHSSINISKNRVEPYCGGSDSSLSATGKKILLCFDGTGNNARDFVPSEEDDKSITNVLKLHLIAGGDINNRRNDVPGQICIYKRGIGGVSENKLLAKGRFLVGRLSHQVKPMRKKLEKVYEKGDKLYVIGFSRGSASARAFVNELNKKGLVTKDGVKIEGKDAQIEFLGCFDTVSMQFFPNLLTIIRNRLLKKMTKCTVLGENGRVASNVKKAVHNMSLDDKNPVLPPVHMGSDDRVSETWFAGAHKDVGGGFYNSGLSDHSLIHMQDWMKSHGLNFLEDFKDIHPDCLRIDGFPGCDIKPEDLKSIEPDHTDMIHYKGDVDRAVVVVDKDEVVPDAPVRVHVSVLRRMEDMKDTETPYIINPTIKKAAKVAVVGRLGEKLDRETKRFAELI